MGASSVRGIVRTVGDTLTRDLDCRNRRIATNHDILPAMTPQSADQSDSERGARLDSWKAIAGHLGRDVRTVLRWEKERGLPVHRVPGGRLQRHALHLDVGRAHDTDGNDPWFAYILRYIL